MSTALWLLAGFLAIAVVVSCLFSDTAWDGLQARWEAFRNPTDHNPEI